MSTPDLRPVILLTFANDRGDRSRHLPGLAAEARRLRAALANFRRAGRGEVEVRQNVTVDEILNLFQEEYRDRVLIFHFGGHADSYQLLLESSQGIPASAAATDLADFLGHQQGIKLVFLNACSNHEHVQGLLNAGVDAVIATTHDIYDHVATEFAARFYTALAGGKTLQSAFDEAAAATKLGHGEQLRDARLLKAPPTSTASTMPPWQIHYRHGAEDTAQWTLPEVPSAAVHSENFLWVGVPTRANLDQIVGREDLLDDLVQRFRDARHAAISLSADGLPGVGKTTMALLLAHDARIQAHFTNGVLWAGLGPTPDVASIQASWAEALGLDLRDEADPHKRQVRISAAIGNRRMLVVIDDAWKLEPAQLLRLSGPHVAHFVTTRNREIARRFASTKDTVKVAVLDDETAWALLQQLAPEACAANPGAAREMVTTAGGLPLAIELLGGYLAAPEQSMFADLSQAAIAEMGDATARLKLAQERLGHAAAGEQTLEAVIQLSLDDLARVDTTAVDAFYALGAFAPKPATFDRAAAEVVTGAGLASLARLISRNLLERNADETLAMHQLAVHQVVHDIAAIHLPVEAVTRHRKHYLQDAAQDNEDWQHIEAIYPQLKHAWQSAHPLDLDTATSFVWSLNTFQKRRGLWQDALDWLNQTLALYQHAEDQAGEATTLNSIGMVYDAIGDKQEALNFFNKALPLHRQVDNLAGEALILNNIGMVYSDLGDMQEALTYFNHALPSHQAVGNRLGAALTLNNMGMVYSAIGDKQQALAYYQQALALHQEVGNRAGEALTLNNIGMVFADLDEKQQALNYFDQALPIHQQVGDISGEATTLNNIGLVYCDLGDMQQARAYFDQALPGFQQVGNISGEALTLNNLGLVSSNLGDNAQAIHYFNQALPRHKQVGNLSGEALTLTNLGLVSSNLGDMQQALSFFNQALPLHQQVGNIAVEATTLNNIGMIYSHLGDKRQALSFFSRALPLHQQVSSKSGEATTLNNIGMIYFHLGDKQQALTYFNQALSLHQQIGNKSGEANTLNNIGLVCSDLGDKQQALSFYNQALLLCQEIGDISGEAYTLNNIGAIHFALDNKPKAIPYFKQALPLLQKVGNLAVEATTLVNLIIIHEDSNASEHAIEYMRSFLACYAQLDPRVATAMGLDQIALQVQRRLDELPRNE